MSIHQVQLLTYLLQNQCRVRSRATGNSMIPNIYPGDKIYIEPVRRNYAIGDILVIKTENKLIVHRLISFKGKDNEILLLKGDNNSFYDPPVSQQNVIGRVYRESHGIMHFYHRLRWRFQYLNSKLSKGKCASLWRNLSSKSCSKPMFSIDHGIYYWKSS